MADLIRVGVVDTTGNIAFEALQKACQAVQIQITRDVKTHWNIDAKVEAFRHIANIPVDYWHTYIVGEGTKSYYPNDTKLITKAESLSQIGLYGYHSFDTDFTVFFQGTQKPRPYAILSYRPDYSIVLSHEIVETIIDPFGDRVMSGEIFNPVTEQMEAVEHLVEVADPSQNPNFGYLIDGIQMSDFVLPAYFDLVPLTGKQYSFTGAIKAPGQIALGGYRSYRNRLGEWWQAFNVDNQIIYKKLSTGETLTANQSGKVIRIIFVLIGVLFVLFGLIFYFKNHQINEQSTNQTRRKSLRQRERNRRLSVSV